MILRNGIDLNANPNSLSKFFSRWKPKSPKSAIYPCQLRRAKCNLNVCLFIRGNQFIDRYEIRSGHFIVKRPTVTDIHKLSGGQPSFGALVSKPPNLGERRVRWKLSPIWYANMLNKPRRICFRFVVVGFSSSATAISRMRIT